MSDPIYQDATMAQVRAVDGTYISYPFIEDGDTQTKVYNMVCTQTAADYNAAQVALDTPMSSAAAAGVIALPFPADSTAYFVGDTDHTPAGGGMISFTRTFANIPQNVTVPSGVETYEFPGILNGDLLVTGIEVVPETGEDSLILTTSAPHGFADGDIAYVRYIVGEDENGDVVVSYGLKYQQNEETGFTSAKIETVISSTKFKIIKTDDFNGYSGVVPTVISGEVRNPEKGVFSILGASMNLTGPGVVFTVDKPHSMGAGTQIAVTASFRVGSESFYHTVNGRYMVTGTPDSTSFIIDCGIVFENFDVLNLNGPGDANITGYERKAVSLPGPTYTRYEYFLPGISSGIDNVEDITTAKPFKIIDTQTGEVVNETRNAYVDMEEYPPGFIFPTIIWPTIPDCNSYIGMVGVGSHLVMSASIQKWAGNIHVRKTKTIRAQ
jgi:hypothetical protein